MQKLINYKRVVEVWFDDYKDIFYFYNPEIKVRTHLLLSVTKAYSEKVGMFGERYHDIVNIFLYSNTLIFQFLQLSIKLDHTIFI